MSNADLFRRHLNNFAKPAEQQDLTVYTDDFAAEFPFAPEGHTRKLEGTAAISRFFAAIPSFAEGFATTEPRIIEAGDQVIAEYEGSSTFIETQRPYHQQYIAVATFRDGKIANLREYYDPCRVLRALGEMD